MGNIRKIRKKYNTPKKLWDKNTIVAEKELTKEYGFKNKKEIWKINTMLDNFKEQAKKIIRTRGLQAEVEKQQLMKKLMKLGLINTDSTLDDILTLTNEDLMKRRLQTIVFKKNMANSVKQARQLIVHRHVAIGDVKVTAPSYLVSVAEEAMISYSPYSSFFRDEHPERAAMRTKLKTESQTSPKESFSEKPKRETKAKDAKKTPKKEEKKTRVSEKKAKKVEA